MIQTYDSQDIAKMVLGDKVKPFSWKTIQAAARAGELRGRKVGKSWRFLEEDVKEWLSYRNG